MNLRLFKIQSVIIHFCHFYDHNVQNVANRSPFETGFFVLLTRPHQFLSIPLLPCKVILGSPCNSLAMILESAFTPKQILLS